ncbi:MAG TPA: maleylacetoacetate isomerase [Caulobacteraceae bacterium]|nr:maleylacetoacetate isomerase [Caulobacteraceae bacterium]
MALTLHSMWRATAPYRVRIGLALKGLDYSYVGHDLAGGEARRAPYVDLNRQGLVPALETDDGVLTQSLAILEWLEETHPAPPLLPKGPRERAIVRSMAEIVACDIHPLNNLRVLQALDRMGHPIGGEDQLTWAQRWIKTGFAALDPMVAKYGGRFAFGETPTIADCCLVPQIWACARFRIDLAPYPALGAVYASAAAHPAFQAAHPERQPDAIK